MSNSRILITGGTGFIGKNLCAKLSEMGHDLFVLTRNKNLKNTKKLKFINDLEEVEFDFDIVINLAGAPISVRWNKKNCDEIYNSRIETTRKIVAKINSAKNPPKALISGSAIGYYGTSETTIFNEKSLPTKQNYFSQKLCFDWEEEAKKATNKTRVVILRTGAVLGKDGGIIKKMKLPFQLGLGGKIGSGKQYLSWIHIDDVVSAIIEIAFNNNSIGTVNLVAPNPVTNSEFSQALAKTLNRPCLFMIPAISMKIVYKERASELLIEGQKVYPKSLLSQNFSFKYEEISKALEEILY